MLGTRKARDSPNKEGKDVPSLDVNTCGAPVPAHSSEGADATRASHRQYCLSRDKD